MPTLKSTIKLQTGHESLSSLTHFDLIGLSIPVNHYRTTQTRPLNPKKIWYEQSDGNGLVNNSATKGRTN